MCARLLFVASAYVDFTAYYGGNLCACVCMCMCVFVYLFLDSFFYDHNHHFCTLIGILDRFEAHGGKRSHLYTPT